ncbi:hypothetical protein Cni_G21295 [Canna indica]|uniref:Translation elongation factor EFTs/EF1B dimerisation domain-containing protein n=1 Tax=Canna indica TaxID=4628 RepID=A0AAQ3KP85_9LILI|nr:hypothetical protein Cni_G21295 [Canna indica]
MKSPLEVGGERKLPRIGMREEKTRELEMKLSDGEEKRKPRKEARKFSDTVRVDKKEVDNDDDQKEAKDEHMHKGRNMKMNLSHRKLSGESTVQNAVAEVAAIVGENVKIRRGYALSTSSHGVIVSYLHTSPMPVSATLAHLPPFELTGEKAKP